MPALDPWGGGAAFGAPPAVDPWGVPAHMGGIIPFSGTGHTLGGGRGRGRGRGSGVAQRWKDNAASVAEERKKRERGDAAAPIDLS